MADHALKRQVGHFHVPGTSIQQSLMDYKHLKGLNQENLRECVKLNFVS